MVMPSSSPHTSSGRVGSSGIFGEGRSDIGISVTEMEGTGAGAISRGFLMARDFGGDNSQPTLEDFDVADLDWRCAGPRDLGLEPRSPC